MEKLVDVAILVYNQTKDAWEAADFMKRFKVPLHVAVRVITKPNQRRHTKPKEVDVVIEKADDRV
jgi:hypothetical protein